MEKIKIYYLCHPYTKPLPKDNVTKSIRITNELLDLGYVIFNPLIHSHFLHMFKSRDAEFWYDLDLKFLSRFDGVIMTPKWRESTGCIRELEFAKKNGLEVLFYDDIKKQGGMPKN